MRTTIKVTLEITRDVYTQSGKKIGERLDQTLSEVADCLSPLIAEEYECWKWEFTGAHLTPQEKS